MIDPMLNNAGKNHESYKKEIQWLLKEKYQGVMGAGTKNDIARIKRSEPIAYVIGFVDFLDCKIDLSQKPLIPRTETEFWVEKMISEMKSQQKVTAIKCLDIFSGSGCVGIAVLKHIPSSTVDFVDSNTKAIKQIDINCKLNSIPPSRWHVIKSDIFDQVTDSYDYIFANPPYISKNKKNEVQESVLLYEPIEALFGGKDGLLYIRKFLSEAKNHLNSNGKIWMEFGSTQKDSISKILCKEGFIKSKFYRDQFGKWRYVVTSK